MAAPTAGQDGPSLQADIAALRERYEEQAHSDQPSPKLQFEFACLLVCSPRRADVREGAQLLDELLEAGFSRAEVLHHLTLTNLKLGQYAKAKEHVDLWLCLQPRNSVARLLHAMVLDKATHDGVSDSRLPPPARHRGRSGSSSLTPSMAVRKSHARLMSSWTFFGSGFKSASMMFPMAIRRLAMPWIQAGKGSGTLSPATSMAAKSVQLQLKQL